MQRRDGSARGAARRRWTAAAALAAALAAGVAGGRVAVERRAESRARVAAAEARAAAAATAAEAVRRDRDIAFYEARVAGDPRGAADRAQLAALYARRGREAGDFEDYRRAEGLAREALALRAARNPQAFEVLAASLLAQHRFAEARDAARRLAELEPDVSAYRATLGEVCLELGDYAGARAAFAAVPLADYASLAVAPRLARWAEVRGDTAQARRLLLTARTRAAAARHLPREQRAWFHLRYGDLELRQGRPDRAEREFAAGLAAHPGDPRLLAAAARLAAARGRWRDAVRLGDSAVAVTLDPATLGVVSDAYAALGDGARAGEYARLMEVAAGQQPGAYHRAWSLFLLDHGRQVPQVLAAARAELAGGRRDVYGYDLLAWALHHAGRPGEARAAADSALAQGTQDAGLFYHAGVIARAAGDPAAARDYLARALAVSAPAVPPGAAAARALLDTLRVAAGRPAPRRTAALTR